MGDKIKVAVLGGGAGAMSAALALSEIDPKGEKYEITLHQLDWRLGRRLGRGRPPGPCRSPLTLTTVRQACLLPGVWTLELGVFDSLPFVTELGLGEPRGGKVTLTTNLGFYANCDYISGTATPIAFAGRLLRALGPARPSVRIRGFETRFERRLGAGVDPRRKFK
jgi:hypothetical protein